MGLLFRQPPSLPYSPLLENSGELHRLQPVLERDMMPSPQMLALLKYTCVLELVALPLTNMATNAARRSFLISTFSMSMSQISTMFLLQIYPSTHLRLAHAKQWVLRYP